MTVKTISSGFDDIQRQKYINKKQSKSDNVNDQAWWMNGVFVIVIHIITLISLLTYVPSYKTIAMTFLLSNFGMLG